MTAPDNPPRISKEEVFLRLYEGIPPGERQDIHGRIVTIDEVQAAIQAANTARPDARPLSGNNPYNFGKDSLRNIARANKQWPDLLRNAGVSFRTKVGDGACFEWIQIPSPERLPFDLEETVQGQAVAQTIPNEETETPLMRWTHCDEHALVQIAHQSGLLKRHLEHAIGALRGPPSFLQANLKQNRTEIDAVFHVSPAEERDLLVSVESKVRETIWKSQIARQATLPRQRAAKGILQGDPVPDVVPAAILLDGYVVRIFTWHDTAQDIDQIVAQTPVETAWILEPSPACFKAPATSGSSRIDL